MAEAATTYIGDELATFAGAHNWKRYLYDRLAPDLRGSVAEVGAGMGATTMALVNAPGVRRWLAIEPDPALHALLAAAVDGAPASTPVTHMAGTLDGVPADQTFDTIIYIDVLEHIEDDHTEIAAATARLNPGGALIVLVPAFQFLYSPFDAAIGHHRRYTARSLRGVAGSALALEKLYYLDTVGFLASLANKLFLRQTTPSAGQVRFWDSVLVPLSRGLDRAHLPFGKSVVAVWRKQPGP